MKKCILILCVCILSVPALIASGTQERDGSYIGLQKVLMSFSDKEAVIVLDTGKTAQSLAAMLPLTVVFNDYMGAEKIGYPGSSWDIDDSIQGYDPKIGDVTCYEPWGNIAIFYRDQPYARGLVPIGTFESGLEEFASMPGAFEVVMTLIKE